MAEKEKYVYTPDYAVPPGETLKETLELSSMSQAELAKRTNLTPKTINGIINQPEDNPITPETAYKLEMVLGLPASFWNNLENNYRETLVRINKTTQLEKDWEWLKSIGVNYRELVTCGFITPVDGIPERVEKIYRWLQIESPAAFYNVYGAAVSQPAYRTSQTFKCEIGTLAVWLRFGEIKAAEVVTEQYNRDKFKELASKIRELSLLNPEEYIWELQEKCASAGVVLVYVPCLPKCPYGASRWLPDGRPLIQLSGRGKRDDHFWFTFLHEAAHIIFDERDSRSKIFLDGDQSTDEKDEKERRANKYATNWLISSDEFIVMESIEYNKMSIVGLAGKIGVAPGIIIGRLQYEGLLSYRSVLNSLKKEITIPLIKTPLLRIR